MPLFYLCYFTSLSCLIGISYSPLKQKYYGISKAMTSLLFVVIAFLTMKKQVNWSWMLAFLFCFMGDVILGLDEKKEQSFCFIGGLSAFVIGHVLFVYTFHQSVPLQGINTIFPFVMSCFVFFLMRLPQFRVQGKRVAIVVYAFIISLLLVKGVEMYVLNRSYLKIMIGTFCFLLSDLILLFLYFYRPQYKILKFLNLITYYTAVFLLAISIL